MEKKITQEEYEMAYNVKNKLINDGIIEVNYMKKLCKRIDLFDNLKKMYNKTHETEKKEL